MSEHQHTHHSLNGALWLTASFTLVELFGGWFSHSLALLADAGHMASDVIALGLAVIANRIAMRPAHTRMTYGYGRARVLAAQMNGLSLWFLSGWITWEAVGRMLHPPQVQGAVVLAVAIMGLAINLIVLKWLDGGHHDINTRAVFWHVLGDALGSVAAIISGVVILWSGWMLIDPALSFFVAGILAFGGWRLMRETTMELMAAVPSDVDISKVERIMAEANGVADIHHLHLWRLPDGQLDLSAHIVINQLQDWPQILRVLQKILKHSGISHTTLQPETGAENISCLCAAHPSCHTA